MLLITRREFARSLKVVANSRYKMSPTAFPRGLADSRAGPFRLKFPKTSGENHTPPFSPKPVIEASAGGLSAEPLTCPKKTRRGRSRGCRIPEDVDEDHPRTIPSYPLAGG